MLILLSAITALAGAARSTWSPCGLSMLSSLTPFGERSRGHRYGVTAAWFILGSTAGGATLGLVAFALAAGASEVGLGRYPIAIGLVAAVVALLGAAVDSGLFGGVLPIIRRQVNDLWLSRYRSWVYAGGFGWQIGTGVATYVMTFSIFVFVALATLSADPLAAFLIATGFGTVRGTAVLLTSRAKDPGELRSVHRRLERSSEPIRWIAIAVQTTAAVTAGAYVGPLVALALTLLAAVALVVVLKPAAGIASE